MATKSASLLLVVVALGTQIAVVNSAHAQFTLVSVGSIYNGGSASDLSVSGD